MIDASKTATTRREPSSVGAAAAARAHLLSLAALLDGLQPRSAADGARPRTPLTTAMDDEERSTRAPAPCRLAWRAAVGPCASPLVVPRGIGNADFAAPRPRLSWHVTRPFLSVTARRARADPPAYGRRRSRPASRTSRRPDARFLGARSAPRRIARSAAFALLLARRARRRSRQPTFFEASTMDLLRSVGCELFARRGQSDNAQGRAHIDGMTTARMHHTPLRRVTPVRCRFGPGGRAVRRRAARMERSGRAGRCAAHCVPGRAARRRRRLSAGQSVLES